MSRLSAVMRAALVALLVVTIPAAVFAQMTRGGLVGTVRDASGGVVPGVTVTVTNLDTNAARVAVSDDQGEPGIAALPDGSVIVVWEDESATAPDRQGPDAVRMKIISPP